MVEPPPGIEEHPEQLREPIRRSRGATPTERLLADLGDKTFLDLWSYPNPFRDQRINTNGEGKELCDFLVICDPHIIIFSEKNITWPDRPLEVAWPRWYRKAVEEAATQLRGAERWIKEHPDRIFLDRRCTTPLPLSLPPIETRKVHRVVVARGAADACRQYFSGGIGSLVVLPKLSGSDHFATSADAFRPFAVGDVDPQGDFVHVFDEAALSVVLGELDTITDFTNYLDKRASFLRSGYLAFAAGEEDLVGYYAIRTNAEGDHDFVPPDGLKWSTSAPLSLDVGHFTGLTSEPAYAAKKAADRISYAWDDLIRTFTKHMLDGTSLVPQGREYSLRKSELGLRLMAQQSRLERRSLSEAWLSALREGQRKDIFFRVVMWPPEDPVGTAFFFVTLKFVDWMKERGGYEGYRLIRAGYAELYAKALLMRHSKLERVVGISREPPNQGGGTSEDCLYAEQTDWSDDERAEVAEQTDKLGIMRLGKPTFFHEEEFPMPDPPAPETRPQYPGLGNRKARRAAKAMARGKR